MGIGFGVLTSLPDEMDGLVIASPKKHLPPLRDELGTEVLNVPSAGVVAVVSGQQEALFFLVNRTDLEPAEF
jgi:hypothetical protein